MIANITGCTWGWDRRLLRPAVGDPLRAGCPVQGGALRRGVAAQRVSLNESGSGFDNWNKAGENATPKDAWTWHAPVKRRGLEGSWMMASASLIGPNTIQIIYLAEEQAITEIQTHKFTPAGIEVHLHPSTFSN